MVAHGHRGDESVLGHFAGAAGDGFPVGAVEALAKEVHGSSLIYGVREALERTRSRGGGTLQYMSQEATRK